MYLKTGHTSSRLATDMRTYVYGYGVKNETKQQTGQPAQVHET